MDSAPSPLPPCSVEPAYRVFLDSLDYLPAVDVERIKAAYAFAAEAHAHQKRMSGEPYITHPLAVAGAVVEWRMDADAICAALMHDVLEDTGTTKHELAERFGKEVAELVDGLSKLDKMEFASYQEAQAENFRKMLMAMARDLRVVLIKLADRQHNLQTMSAMRADKRARIARETLEIYAPIALRLGLNKLYRELQDLCFTLIHPHRAEVLARALRAARGNRKELLTRILDGIRDKLAHAGLRAEVFGREKSLYSIFRKMKDKQLSFSQVLDIYGFRVVVDNVPTCYLALGALHSLFKPVPGKFKDYIAIPKANGYQSLHTVLFGPYGSPIEVQIRTREMDLVAERGVAAHWAYKHGGEAGNSAQSRASAWIANLVESQRGTGSSLEFLENVKVDLFPDEVYLFSPKGDILALPRNSTALDFAYTVHTDVGNHAVAARVDRKLVPLRAKLASGQTVEIITAKSAAPAPQWLEFVVTGKARTAIRQQLKQLEHEDAVQLGHRMLDRALGAQGTSLDRVATERLDGYLAENRYPRLEALLADIALGNRMPAQVAQALAQEQAPQLLKPAAPVPQDRILITGAERGVVSFAQCCMPIPGDEIMGYHSTGKGIVVHRLDCANVAEYRKSPERWVSIGWDRQVSGDFDAMLRVEVENRPGVLAQVAAAIAHAESNIDRVEYLDRDTRIAAIRFAIEVSDRKHLAEVIRRIRRLNVVHGVQRL